jgi:AraC-like DNA-binding protein
MGDQGFALNPEMAVGARTVQRQLAAEGSTFQAELNATREALARHYLARDDLSVPHVAYLLGYAEHERRPRPIARDRASDRVV